MSHVVLYHKGCPDGFGAAWLLERTLAIEAKLVPMDWHQPVPIDDITGATHLWSVDYCPDAQWITMFAGIVKTFTILDHHQSSINEIRESGFKRFDRVNVFSDVSELGGLDKVSIVLDQTHSGIGLVAAVARRQLGVGIPWFVKHIEDRDLWRFDFTDTADVCAAIASHPQTIEAWDALAEREPHEVIAEGRAINRFRQQLVEQCAASSVRLPIGEYEVQSAVSPYAIGSDVAGLLAEQSPDGIGGYIILHEKHVQFGLRSRGDGPDVAKIAESYGGGGHRNASGFTADYADFGFMAHHVYA